MKFNFDKIIDRTNNFSAKWSEMNKNFGTNDLLPMWVGFFNSTLCNGSFKR